MSKAANQSITSTLNKKSVPTLTRKQQLYELIVDSRGRPDTLAINLYWDELRSWYNDKKQYKGGRVVNFPKLHSKGIHVCYGFLADRYKVTQETIRRKIVKLEKLGLLSRDFEQNINYGKALFNQLVIYIWQQTDHFYNPIGIDRAKVGELKPSTNHKYISSKYNTPHIHQNEDRGYPQNVDTYGTGVCIGIHTGDDTKTLRPVLKEITSSYAREVISVSSILKEETNTHARTNKSATFAPCLLTQQEQVAHGSEQQTNQVQSLTNSSQLSASDEKAIDTQRKERTSENTGLITMSDLMTQILNNQEELPQEDKTPEMKQEEIPQITDKQERAMLLSKALCGAFGEQRSNEIQDDYKFVELAPDRLCIQTQAMLLNDIDKAKVRRAIKSIYGEEITITMQIIATEITEPKQEYEVPVVNTMPKQNWFKFKANVKDNRVLEILTNRLVKVIENQETLIVEGAPFFIDQLTETGNLAQLEETVVQTGITLELHYKGMNTEYANSVKKPIVLTLEKIQEDRAWIKRHREAIKKLDN